MPELEQLLATVSEGLKSLASGIEEIAQRIETLGAAKTKGATAGKKAPKPKRAKSKPKRSTKKKSTSKKATTQKAKPTTATDTVMAVISKAPKGIKTADIKAETGFDEKKVYNIVFKLKQQRKIKTVRRGVYIKA